MAGRPRGFDLDDAIDRALTLFWEQGYAGTSLAQLRSTLGISSASFYAAFGSKESLFEMVLARYIRGPGSVTDVVGDPDLTGREAVSRLLHGSIAMQTDPAHPRGCLVALSATVGGDDVPAAVRGLVADRRAADRKRIRDCVERSVARGELDPTTDASALAATLHGFLLGISTQARDGVPASDLNRAADSLLTTWDAAAV
ncbi:TetR/AcrR family transcriptional regulator [Frondihabitans cladoniiphilus]|uniref:TetR/AcrR family transcriptional regulator n=1 Tax=Frondihabitans cladoniiphilus TaxID=715785 RepID=A0ABP8VNP7_9MICO